MACGCSSPASRNTSALMNPAGQTRNMPSATPGGYAVAVLKFKAYNPGETFQDKPSNIYYWISSGMARAATEDEINAYTAAKAASNV